MRRVHRRQRFLQLMMIETQVKKLHTPLPPTPFSWLKPPTVYYDLVEIHWLRVNLPPPAIDGWTVTERMNSGGPVGVLLLLLCIQADTQPDGGRYI